MSKLDALSDAEIAKIGKLVEVLDKSAFDFMTLELGDFRLTVGTGNAAAGLAGGPAAGPVHPVPSGAAGSAPAPAPMPMPATAQSAAAAASPAQAADSGAPGSAAPSSPASQPPSAEAVPGAVDVTATTMGRFYSRPEPNAAPFVSVGAQVESSSTVGLIEVMKLFNSVAAGVDGVVAQICVEDGQLVEYGQVLMRVCPAGAAG
ncbi:hypothetical protein GCM10023144_43510 [Pigmentiphaga soli]|uniref:Biotin carboxyl carrier protein of acetyl-CoA carboxylase n=1 Tax=Pigmentiphaga soli TaxID=1007095 RepID=A0ABP8HP83_9BURK